VLRPDVEFLPLDDDVVAFSEEAQCLIGLNASAARVARRLGANIAPSTIEHELASEGIASPEEAAKWVATVLDSLGSHGLLSDGKPASERSPENPNDVEYLARMAREMPPYAPFVPVEERRYRLLDACVLIRFGHVAQLKCVNSVIGHLATDDNDVPTVTMEIKATISPDRHLRSDIYRDGTPIGYAVRPPRLGPVVKGALWSLAINTYNFALYIHAGVVGTGESCVLLPAAPGSGKSSLTAALTHKGFRYFSDEVALIDASTFHVAPMPFALCIKEPGWDLIGRYFPQLSDVLVHWRQDGKVVRYFPPPPGTVQKARAPVSHMVFPRYCEGSRTEMRSIPRSEALGRLMEECLALRQRLNRENVTKLLRWMAGIDCYALTFSSLDEAVEQVSSIVQRP
jgi:hypothetical protein